MYQNTSGFGFGHVWHLRRSNTICTPNFDKISQSVVEILLLPVSENKRLPYWNSTSGFEFDLFIVIYTSFCISLPDYIRTGVRWCSYDTTAIYKMAAIVLTLKRIVLAGKHIVWAIKHENPWSGSIWARSREKRIGQSKKVTKVLYFTYLGRSPQWTDLDQKFAWSLRSPT